jgi:hypothetical protein
MNYKNDNVIDLTDFFEVIDLTTTKRIRSKKRRTIKDKEQRKSTAYPQKYSKLHTETKRTRKFSFKGVMVKQKNVQEHYSKRYFDVENAYKSEVNKRIAETIKKHLGSSSVHVLVLDGELLRTSTALIESGAVEPGNLVIVENNPDTYQSQISGIAELGITENHHIHSGVDDCITRRIPAYGRSTNLLTFSVAYLDYMCTITGRTKGTKLGGRWWDTADVRDNGITKKMRYYPLISIYNLLKLHPSPTFVLGLTFSARNRNGERSKRYPAILSRLFNKMGYSIIETVLEGTYGGSSSNNMWNAVYVLKFDTKIDRKSIELFRRGRKLIGFPKGFTCTL